MLEKKLDALRASLRDMESVVVCYSGGVDSVFLLKVAVDELGDKALALTALSPALAQREAEQAKSLAVSFGARHILRRSQELADDDYSANPSNRCYYCKTELMRIAAEVADEERARFILIGTNLDDLGGHRPGLKAANEGSARHPLVEAELSKREIRALSKRLGLSTWDKPQMACLASRFPYGTAITAERLNRVEAFEAALLNLGFLGLRVRFHDAVARLELEPDQLARAIDPEIRQAIVSTGKELGFAFVALDLAGYRTGAMNEMIGVEADPDEEQVARAKQTSD